MSTKSENTKKNTTKEQEFSYSELRKSCLKVFGVTSSTFDGATCNMNRDGLYTISEIKTVINGWLKKEVK